MNDLKKCPFCSESIKKDAKKCRYCGEWLNEKETPTKSAVPPLKKYYLLWILSIILFFTTFFFSTNHFISDQFTYILVGSFALLGTFLFIRLVYLLTRPSAKNNRLKYALLCVGGFILFAILAVNPPPEINTASPKVAVNEKQPLCNRTDYYPMPPEFKRAISLIAQRTEQALASNPNGKLSPEEQDVLKKMGKYQYCLDIQYKDLSGYNAEGIFTIDPNSTPDRLTIFVDNSYKSNDDLLTALLLDHEITHARQYYEDILGIDGIITKTSDSPSDHCFNKEIEAFMSQYATLTTLNQEEVKSLYYRIQDSSTSNSAYGNVTQTLAYALAAYNQCNSLTNYCAASLVQSNITNYVKSSPYYQQQCRQNSEN